MTAAAAPIARQAVPQCPACGSADKHALWDLREHEYDNTTSEAFPLVACRGCGAWYLDPRPHESALDVIYPRNYYSYYGVAGASAKLDSRVAERLFRSRFEPIDRRPAGWRSAAARVRCWTGWRAMGLDFSESAVAICRGKGYEARTTRFEDLDPTEIGSFDVVHSAHVIEHVASPLEYMRKAYQLLKPGGLCAFATPNKDTWEARVFRRHWGGLHAPRHWTLLDAKSAVGLGERCGFQTLEVSWSRSGVFWTWTAHSMLQSLLGRRVADALFPSDHRINDPGLVNVARTAAGAVLDMANARLFGRSSTMVCVFRKPSN